MKLNDIKQLASFNVLYYVEKVKQHIKNFPKGADIQIPSYIIDDLELALDNRKIPCYKVCDNYLSVAQTYMDLYDHEMLR